MGEAVDLLGEAVGSEAFESLHNAGVEHVSPLQQEAVIGDLVREGVFESVLQVREEAGLV